jgi:hypothetical protein
LSDLLLVHIFRSSIRACFKCLKRVVCAWTSDFTASGKLFNKTAHSDRGAVVSQSVYCLTTCWTTGFRFPAEAKDFSCSFVSRPVLRPTQPPIQWVPGVKRGRGLTLTTHTLLVPRSRMCRSYAFPPWRLHGGSGTALLYLLSSVCVSTFHNVTIGSEFGSTEYSWHVLRSILPRSAKIVYPSCSTVIASDVAVPSMISQTRPWREDMRYQTDTTPVETGNLRYVLE